MTVHWMLVALFLDKPMFHPKIAPQTLPQIVFGSCRTLIQYHNSCVAIPCSTKLHRSINTSPCINICMNIYICIFIYKSLYYIYIHTHLRANSSASPTQISRVCLHVLYIKNRSIPCCCWIFPWTKMLRRTSSTSGAQLVMLCPGLQQ